MAIQVECAGCSSRFRVKDELAGKRVKCPKCGGGIAVPGAGGSAQPAAKTKSAPAPVKKKPKPAVENWYLKTSDGETYGPITRTELDEWVEEDRLDDEAQILRDGSDQWQWATDLYPQLEEGDDEDEEAEAAADNPFSFAAADASPSPGLGGFDAAEEPSGAPAMTAPATTAPATGGDAEVGEKSKMVAGLLAIFLGGWGVHRFYLGYTGLGIAMIAANFGCCAGTIWGIVDGVRILTGKFDRDAAGNLLKD